MWFCGNSNHRLFSRGVGQKTANHFGLFDMHGNVSELCEDWFHSSYNEAPTDGSAWNDPKGNRRVVRGGSWLSNTWGCRSAMRGSLPPDLENGQTGFRVVLPSSTNPAPPAAAPAAVEANTGPCPGLIELSWNTVIGVSGYRVFYEEASDGPDYIPIKDGSPSSGSDVGNKNTQTFYGLTPGTRYYFAVKAYNSAGESVYSNPTNALAGQFADGTITIDIPNLPQGARMMKLVRIPRGSFQMGSPESERSRDKTEGPVHLVMIDYDFYMGETEVTQAQWEAIMGSNPANSWGVGHDYPVYDVSWNDIRQSNGFLDRLDEQTSQNGFRLPTEAEWEYACRAGTQTRFFFGDSLGGDDRSQNCSAGTLPGNRSDYMWFDWSDGANGFLRLSKEVGILLPNQWGLYDMHGNLWEWCEDYWHSNYTGATSDGSAWILPTSMYRVVRGGVWSNYAEFCRSAKREGSYPSGHTTVGFRVVLPVSE